MINDKGMVKYDKRIKHNQHIALRNGLIMKLFKNEDILVYENVLSNLKL